jgi:hypothetical protein
MELKEKERITMSSSSIPDSEFFKELFGFDHKIIEEKVEDLPGLYKNLSPEALYTSYEDLLEIFQSPWVSGSWIDLGAGVGQSALMYAYLYPEKDSFALERDEARIRAGKEVQARLKLFNAHLIEADLLAHPIPDGESYFLYFPTGHVLDRILHELKNKQNFKRLIAIESHGDLLSRLARVPWLKLVGSIPLSSPRHYPEAQVFERISREEITGPHEVSFKERILVIQDEDERRWLGESFGLEWLGEEKYQLAHPPRTILWKQVQEVLSFDEFDQLVQFLLRIRRLSELKISSTQGLHKGAIRKIEISPSFSVEISSGEWVEWSEIKRITWGETLCFEASSDYFYLPPVPWEK